MSRLKFDKIPPPPPEDDDDVPPPPPEDDDDIPGPPPDDDITPSNAPPGGPRVSITPSASEEQKESKETKCLDDIVYQERKDHVDFLTYIYKDMLRGLEGYPDQKAEWVTKRKETVAGQIEIAEMFKKNIPEDVQLKIIIQLRKFLGLLLTDTVCSFSRSLNPYSKIPTRNSYIDFQNLNIDCNRQAIDVLQDEFWFLANMWTEFHRAIQITPKSYNYGDREFLLESAKILVEFEKMAHRKRDNTKDDVALVLFQFTTNINALRRNIQRLRYQACSYLSANNYPLDTPLFDVGRGY